MTIDEIKRLAEAAGFGVKEANGTLTCVRSASKLTINCASEWNFYTDARNERPELSGTDHASLCRFLFNSIKTNPHR
jgi:hypothetical protein